MANTIKRDSIRVDIELDKGSSFRHSWVYRTGVEGAELAVDLTGCTARLLVKNLLADKTVGDIELLDLTTENGGMILEETETGEITVIVEDDASDAFTWNDGYHNLELYFPNGDTKRLMRGFFTAFDENSR